MAVSPENRCVGSGDKIVRGSAPGEYTGPKYGMVTCPGCGRKLRPIAIGRVPTIPPHSRHGRKGLKRGQQGK